MLDLRIPTLRDVARARVELSKNFSPSPFLKFSGLDNRTGLDLHLKMENMLPTGSFKVRGATYLVSQLTPEERKRGVVAASTGNFSQGIAYASGLYGVRARIVMPENANPVKVRATESLGAEVVFSGEKFDDARLYAEEIAESSGARYVHSANEPLLVAGVGTHTLEILEEVPDIDTIIVPVGGGSGACGASVAAHAFDPEIQVIGVQSMSSPAAYLSWKGGEIVRAQNETYAEGLATGEGYEYTQEIMREHLHDFILVSDGEIRSAMSILAVESRIVPESASSSALAAALKIRGQLEGKRVALIMTGGNSPREQIMSLLGGSE